MRAFFRSFSTDKIFCQQSKTEVGNSLIFFFDSRQSFVVETVITETEHN